MGDKTQKMTIDDRTQEFFLFRFLRFKREGYFIRHTSPNTVTTQG